MKIKLYEVTGLRKLVQQGPGIKYTLNWPYCATIQYISNINLILIVSVNNFSKWIYIQHSTFHLQDNLTKLSCKIFFLTTKKM